MEELTPATYGRFETTEGVWVQNVTATFALPFCRHATAAIARCASRSKSDQWRARLDTMALVQILDKTNKNVD